MSIADKKLSVKSIIIFTLILPVVVIALSTAAICLTASTAGEQKTFDFSLVEEASREKISIPADEEAALELAERITREAVESGILKYEGNNSVRIENISCKNESLSDILTYASGSFSEKLLENHKNYSIKYGENADRLVSLLPESIPEAFEAEINNGILTLKLSFKEKMFGNMYFLDGDSKAIKRFAFSNKDVFTAADEDAKGKEYTYIFVADAVSGRLLNMEIARQYKYSAFITFNDTLEGIDCGDFSMELCFSEVYNLSYAGIEILQEYITLEKNGYAALSMVADTEQGLGEDEYKLEMISSDEGVATVDENGQVDAISLSDKPVIITVRLTYLGREFTDSCTVYVVKPVESIRLTDSEISLHKGEEHTLTAEVKPSDATIKTVEYYSSDENVARVDENGRVTAVNEGEAVIYAVTLQGFICTECTVAVE